MIRHLFLPDSLYIAYFFISDLSFVINWKNFTNHHFSPQASGCLLEHTLVAKAMTCGMGADYIEQDVVLSKDNQPIVLHEIYLDVVIKVVEVFPDQARNDGKYYSIDFAFVEIERLAVTERFNTE